MEKIKSIIIDDEIQARSLLKSMLNTFCQNVEVLETCSDLPNGIKAIHKYKPDLIFLDIEMPGHSGLELLDFFNENDLTFAIIFTTAYSEYAIKAFKLSAIDYLLKPIEPSELELSVANYAKRKTINTKEIVKKLEFLKHQEPNKIGIPTQNGFKFIETKDILFIKADNSYTELMSVQHEKNVISRTLKNFEEALNPFPNFQRSHKSYIVNTDYITDYVKSDGGYLILEKKYHVPIASEKVESILKDKLFIKR